MGAGVNMDGAELGCPVDGWRVDGRAVVGEEVFVFVGEVLDGLDVVGDFDVGDPVLGALVDGDPVEIVGETELGDIVIGEPVDIGDDGDSVVGVAELGSIDGEKVGDFEVGELEVGDRVVGPTEVGEAVVGDAVLGDLDVGVRVVGTLVTGEAVVGKPEFEGPDEGASEVGALDGTIVLSSPGPITNDVGEADGLLVAHWG